MENCGFGFGNRIINGTLSASAEAPDLPASNLQNASGAASLGWRVNGLEAILSLSLTASGRFRAISVHRTNLTASAKWQIQIRDGDNDYDSGQIDMAIVTGQAVHVLPQEINGDAVTIHFSDIGNPDGFLSIPLAYAGLIYQPERNFSTQSTVTEMVGEQVTSSLSGGDFVEPRFIQRVMTIGHQSLGDHDLMAVKLMQEVAAADRNILFLPDPSAQTCNRDAVFGRMKISEISNPFGVADRHACNFTISERL